MAKLAEIEFSGEKFFIPLGNKPPEIECFGPQHNINPNNQTDFFDRPNRKLSPYEITKNMYDIDLILVRMIEESFPDLLWQGGDAISRSLPPLFTLVWHLHTETCAKTRFFLPNEKSIPIYKEIERYLKFTYTESINKECSLPESADFPNLEKMKKLFEKVAEQANKLFNESCHLEINELGEGRYLFNLVKNGSPSYSYQVSWLNNSSNPKLQMVNIDVLNRSKLESAWGLYVDVSCSRIRIYRLTETDNRFGPEMNAAQQWAATAEGNMLHTPTGKQVAAETGTIVDALPNKKMSPQKKLIVLSRYLFNLCKGVPFQDDQSQFEIIDEYIISISEGIHSGEITSQILEESRHRLIGAFCFDPNIFFKKIIFNHKIESIFPHLTVFKTTEFQSNYEQKMKKYYLNDQGEETGAVALTVADIEKTVAAGVYISEFTYAMIMSSGKRMSPRNIGKILSCLGENKKIVPVYTGRFEPIFWMFEYAK